MSAICHSSLCVRGNDEFQEKRMALDKEAAKKVLTEIDRNELAQLGCDLTSIPSPTGKEKAITEFILTWFGKWTQGRASRCGGGPSQCRWHSQGRRHGAKSRFQRPHGHELHRHRRRHSHGRQH